MNDRRLDRARRRAPPPTQQEEEGRPSHLNETTTTATSPATHRRALHPTRSTHSSHRPDNESLDNRFRHRESDCLLWSDLAGQAYGRRPLMVAGAA